MSDSVNIVGGKEGDERRKGEEGQPRARATAILMYVEDATTTSKSVIGAAIVHLF